MTVQQLPAWAAWTASRPYSVGIEEEVMILDPVDWALAQQADDLLPALSAHLAGHVSSETHRGVIELATSPHSSAPAAGHQAAALRSSLLAELEQAGLRAAVAGTHPMAMWTDTQISSGARYQLVHQSMRELARREPTFALHVHVAVSNPEDAIVLLNRLRVHVPLLLAVSANSPFWQGRDSGLASTRTPIFQAFPRVGLPRAFSSYFDYAQAVDQMLRCDAFPEPTFIWWDVRPQPRFGTVEVRVMDAQTTSSRLTALAGLVQSIAHLELEEGYHGERLVHAPEILDENRFLAARDGIGAELLDPVAERRVRASEQLARLLQAVRPHAQQLGCESAVDAVAEMARDPGAERQRRCAHRRGLRGLIELMADEFA